MYAIVLATAMTAGTAAPDLHFRGGCYGCNGGNAFSSCYGCYGCYGGGFGSSCYGCYGCYGSGFAVSGSCCGGCYGSSFSFSSCYGCYGSCYGSCYGGGWASFEAYGGFGGCGGCFGGCFGGCTGYYGGAMPTYFTPMAAAPRTMKPANGGTVSETTAPATVIVKAPLDATVTVNGQATTRTTAEQTFQSPALVAGKTYAYNFEASIEKDGVVIKAAKRITVEANSRSVVDFTDLGADKSASAKVTVLMPRGAKLFINDAAYGGGEKQTFDTPKLAAGKRFFYTGRTESKRAGRPVSETRRVTVEAGKTVTVDFTATPREVLTASR